MRLTVVTLDNRALQAEVGSTDTVLTLKQKLREKYAILPNYDLYYNSALVSQFKNFKAAGIPDNAVLRIGKKQEEQVRRSSDTAIPKIPLSPMTSAPASSNSPRTHTASIPPPPVLSFASEATPAKNLFPTTPSPLDSVPSTWVTFDSDIDSTSTSETSSSGSLSARRHYSADFSGSPSRPTHHSVDAAPVTSHSGGHGHPVMSNPTSHPLQLNGVHSSVSVNMNMSMAMNPNHPINTSMNMNMMVQHLSPTHHTMTHPADMHHMGNANDMHHLANDMHHMNLHGAPHMMVHGHGMGMSNPISPIPLMTSASTSITSTSPHAHAHAHLHTLNNPQHSPHHTSVFDFSSSTTSTAPPNVNSNNVNPNYSLPNASTHQRAASLPSNHMPVASAGGAVTTSASPMLPHRSSIDNSFFGHMTTTPGAPSSPHDTPTDPFADPFSPFMVPGTTSSFAAAAAASAGLASSTPTTVAHERDSLGESLTGAGFRRPTFEKLPTILQHTPFEAADQTTGGTSPKQEAQNSGHVKPPLLHARSLPAMHHSMNSFAPTATATAAQTPTPAQPVNHNPFDLIQADLSGQSLQDSFSSNQEDLKSRVASLQSRLNQQAASCAMALQMANADNETLRSTYRKLQQELHDMESQHRSMMGELEGEKADLERRIMNSRAHLVEREAQRGRELQELREVVSNLKRQFGHLAAQRDVVLAGEFQQERTRTAKSLYQYLQGIDRDTYRMLVAEINGSF
eukprot:TRINITY_DN2247_c0_g7_i1.p1 TRINITY_DN2247_c0_g7~~TRINITY_DN2247_c0_g7_i1.p1  ORF type:complete len:739 (-),score=158.38 TRINITY_DN2247_c0_g7_i1:146-2362(-)